MTFAMQEVLDSAKEVAFIKPQLGFQIIHDYLLTLEDLPVLNVTATISATKDMY
jgi:hypothetical protein